MKQKFNVWYPKIERMFEARTPAVLVNSNGRIALAGAEDAGEGIILPFTGLTDQNEEELYDGDITSLDVDGETRYFKVTIKTVEREMVLHQGFVGETAKVAVTGVAFEWNGYDLFPCVDEDGVPDNKRMQKVGNIYKNPELLSEVGS